MGLHSKRYSARLSFIATDGAASAAGATVGLAEATGGDSAGRAAATTGFFFFAIGFFGGVHRLQGDVNRIGCELRPWRFGLD